MSRLFLWNTNLLEHEQQTLGGEKSLGTMNILECEPARGDSEGEETCLLASFPGLPTIQFLITCSMQKPEAEKVWKQV